MKLTEKQISLRTFSTCIFVERPHPYMEICLRKNSIKSTSTTKIPTAIVAHTTKGKGVSFMEDDNNWHYRIPNEEELIKALSELEIK